ncbi:MAG: hypothetical protein ACK2UK_00865 [Candidatus Promineifilaceae bacterium]
MTTPRSVPPRGQRSATKRIVGLLLVVCLLSIPLLLDVVERLMFAPWSLALGGRPTLTGEWLADVALEDGTQGSLFLTLDAYVGETGGPYSSNLQGEALYCLGAYSGYLEVYGTARRDGTVTDLRFRSLEDEPVWLVNNASGRWSGETLTISATSSLDPTAAHIARSDQPSPRVTFVFAPGDEGTFDARCAGR